MQKKTSEKLLYSGAGFIFAALLILAFFSNQLAPASCASVPSDSLSGSEPYRNTTIISVPTDVYLFDEKIPLENWEVRERFERDFYYNYNYPDQIILWWKRLGRWGTMIDSMLDAAHLSRDLKYLMIAESGAKNVSSPSKASGYWQFIPPTADEYGLRVDNWIDERLDPVLSTKAAVKYFLRLKSLFEGDYLLMAASYNMGESAVFDARKFQHQNNYWNLYLNEETMRYPIRIAVVKEFLEHGSRYGFHFDRAMAYKMQSVKTVTVQGPISSLADWALSQGYTYKDVKVFNPRFIGRDLPRGTFEIQLPATDADRTTVK